MAEKVKKDWARRTHPAPPVEIPPRSWRAVESERKNSKKNKPVQIRAFSHKHYQFFPCSVTKLRKAGYVYYLLTRTRSGILLIEENSPRFKTKEEAIAFATEHKLTGYIPG